MMDTRVTGKTWIRTALWAAAIGMLISNVAIAGDYYVSFAGSDLAGDGSHGNPWCTITHALQSIPTPTTLETQTIHIGPGQWRTSEREVFPLRVPQGVILRGAGHDITILSGIKASSRQPLSSYGQVLVMFTSPPGGPVPGIAPGQVTHLSMMYARAGVEVQGDMNNVPEPYIHDVKFWKNQIGVQITNGAPVVENCLFDGNSMGISSGRITTVGQDTGIHGNRFYRNTYGINAANSLDMVAETNWFEANGVGIMLGTVGLVTATPLLRNNVYFQNGQGFTCTAVLGGRMLPRLIHETFYANQTGVASIDDMVFGGQSNPSISNSIIWGSSVNDTNGVSQDEVRYSVLSRAVGAAIGPIIGVNGIMAEEPRFVDASGGNLHLSDMSPLIDRGSPDTANLPAVDRDGHPRSVGFPDMGAYEACHFLKHERSASRNRELRLVLTARRDLEHTYILAASFLSDPQQGIPLGGRVLPLHPDSLFFATIGTNGLLPGFLGHLNGAGQAQVRVMIPEWTWLQNHTVYVAYVTLDPMAPAGVRTISNVVAVALNTL